MWRWTAISLVAIGLWAQRVIPAKAEKIRVVATTNDLKWAVEQVGGERVEVVALMHPLQNPHTVQPRPSFIVHLNRADLLVRIGLDYEEVWLPPLLDEARNPRVRRGGLGYVDTSVGIPLLEVPTTRITREQGEVHLFGNPHYWLDPANMRMIARNIAEGLKRVAPQHAAEFDRNLRQLEEELNALREEAQRWAAPLKGQRVIAYHTTWSYLANLCGFQVMGYLEPKPGIPPSAAHLADLILRAKAEGVRLLLKEPFYESRTPNLVAQRIGAVVVEVAPTIGGEPETETYPKLLRHIIGKLVKALRGG